MMRYAAYLRISSEEQLLAFSIDAQRRITEAYVEDYGGNLVEVYIDEAKSARTTNRAGLQQMCIDAAAGKFDALILHKFDRLSRNREDALALKAFLRYDCGIKVLSATEPSEDTDYEDGMFIEGTMDCVAEWYIVNMGAEIAKGKRERTAQAKHNNYAPFGMMLDENSKLYPNPGEAPGLIMAFEAYATGKYSDSAISKLLNEAAYRTRFGRLFSTDTVRDILQNQTYLGKLKYQRTSIHSDGRRTYENPVEWHEGGHEPIIPLDLFQRCQEMRAKRTNHRHTSPKSFKKHFYLLQGRIYCAYCCANLQTGLVKHQTWGKMKISHSLSSQTQYYACRANEFGIQCEQKRVRVEDVDEQFINALMQTNFTREWQDLMIVHLEGSLDKLKLDFRLETIHALIDAIGFDWVYGFIPNKDGYVAKRLQLKEAVFKEPKLDFIIAEDLVKQFKKYITDALGNPTMLKLLIQLFVERILIREKEVVGIWLKGDYHLMF